MSRDLVRVSPAAIQWRLSIDMEHERFDHERWSRTPRHRVDQTEKHRSIVQRYVEGKRWEETPLFTRIYPQRLTREPSVRGSASMVELLAQYYGRVDAMFEDMKANGWRRIAEGRETQPILVYLSHDDELLMGNQGNHRLAMAQVLNLDHVLVEIVGRHPESGRVSFEAVPDLAPALPKSAREIPAMTTDAERRCYYHWTMQQAPEGAVVELGAWLGASTAYIAAGIRDAMVKTKAQVYDRFVWKPASHDKKAGGPIGMSQFEAFRKNLGPLLAYVDAHPTEVTRLAWKGGPVSLLICDAPKRIPEIASVLSTFASSMRPGSMMAWQDFAYFPSYDIPAALIALGDRLEFVEAAYPGTTAVFRIRAPWRREDVTSAALALSRWTPDRVEREWDRWTEILPHGMRPRFRCGAAMFLCDLGAIDQARTRLAQVVAEYPKDVLPKWQYLITERARLMQRYSPLVEVIRKCG